MFKQTLRQHLEKVFSNGELNRWFDPLTMQVDKEKGVLRVAFPHPYFGDWFMQAVKKDFEQAARGCTPDTAIFYENCGRCLTLRSASRPSATMTLPDQAEPPYRIGPEQTQDSPPLPDEPCTFDSFLVNRKNDFPLAAARECVAKASAPPYVPFILYGQSGCGKTHLLRAMAHALRQASRPVRFGGMELLERLQGTGDLAGYKGRHVFLDDVQSVAASATLQDTLIRLIDFFQNTGSILALSLDSYPGQYAGFSHKLRSRLAGGLTLELKNPDLDIRRQYVQRENNKRDLGLSKEQILTVAQRHQDIRGLEGALARIFAFRNFQPQAEDGSPIPDVASLLDHGLENQSLTPVSIMLTVARDFSLPPEELSGKSRDKDITLARHIAILLCRELIGLSLVQTGRIFGGRDHSSVLYSIRKIKQLQASNKDMHKRVEDLRKLCLTRH